MMYETYDRVENYQKITGLEHSIKRFSFVEMKKFQLVLESGENQVEEAHSFILGAKEECVRR